MSTSNIPPSDPAAEFLKNWDPTSKEKILLKAVKYNKNGEPEGLKFSPKQEEYSGFFGRLRVLWNKKDYNLNKNIGMLKVKIESMIPQTVSLKEKESTESLKNKYNEFVEKVAYRKFQKKWYKIFTTVDDITKQQKNFIEAHQITKAVTLISSNILKVQKPLSPPSPQQQKVENPLKELTESAKKDQQTTVTPPTSSVDGRNNVVAPHSSKLDHFEENQHIVGQQPISLPAQSGTEKLPQSSAEPITRYEEEAIGFASARSLFESTPIPTDQGDATKKLTKNFPSHSAPSVKSEDNRDVSELQKHYKQVEESVKKIIEQFQEIGQEKQEYVQNLREVWASLGTVNKVQNTNLWKEKLKAVKVELMKAEATCIAITKEIELNQKEEYQAFTGLLAHCGELLTRRLGNTSGSLQKAYIEKLQKILDLEKENFPKILDLERENFPKELDKVLQNFKKKYPSLEREPKQLVVQQLLQKLPKSIEKIPLATFKDTLEEQLEILAKAEQYGFSTDTFENALMEEIKVENGTKEKMVKPRSLLSTQDSQQEGLTPLQKEMRKNLAVEDDYREYLNRIQTLAAKSSQLLEHSGMDENDLAESKTELNNGIEKLQKQLKAAITVKESGEFIIDKQLIDSFAKKLKAAEEKIRRIPET
ncbi:MAG: hypothetical protein JWO53_640 [Chlamydiia bacterium]|nr:hypothetical protein [Chlamydiia bacterium]